MQFGVLIPCTIFSSRILPSAILRHGGRIKVVKFQPSKLLPSLCPALIFKWRAVFSYQNTGKFKRINPYCAVPLLLFRSHSKRMKPYDVQLHYKGSVNKGNKTKNNLVTSKKKFYTCFWHFSQLCGPHSTFMSNQVVALWLYVLWSKHTDELTRVFYWTIGCYLLN